jgi:selenide, water dikinase
VGMPINVLPHDVIAQVLRGGEDVCAAAGIPVAGGHSIDSVEPIYGLAAIGVVHPDRVKRNASAREGDVLVLGKPLGVGVLSAALKKDRLDAAGYQAMVAAATKLNTPGAALAVLDGVHAMTDVTGFGLLGHTLEIARGAGLTARVRYADLPFLPGVEAFVADGVLTGASGRNWASYGDGVTLGASLPPVAQALLTDPQTSGGLLVSCAPDCVGEVLAIMHADGFAEARVIGELAAGPARVEVI